MERVIQSGWKGMELDGERDRLCVSCDFPNLCALEKLISQDFPRSFRYQLEFRSYDSRVEVHHDR